MKVLEWREDGTPRVVELTDAEQLVSEMHARLLDRGFDQGSAVLALRAADVPGGLRSEAPALDAVLADEQFVLWLSQ
jgi:hypothetical protein